MLIQVQALFFEGHLECWCKGKLWMFAGQTNNNNNINKNLICSFKKKSFPCPPCCFPSLSFYHCRYPVETRTAICMRRWWNAHVTHLWLMCGLWRIFGSWVRLVRINWCAEALVCMCDSYATYVWFVTHVQLMFGSWLTCSSWLCVVCINLYAEALDCTCDSYVGYDSCVVRDSGVVRDSYVPYIWFMTEVYVTQMWLTCGSWLMYDTYVNHDASVVREYVCFAAIGLLRRRIAHITHIKLTCGSWLTCRSWLIYGLWLDCSNWYAKASDCTCNACVDPHKLQCWVRVCMCVWYVSVSVWLSLCLCLCPCLCLCLCAKVWVHV